MNDAQIRPMPTKFGVGFVSEKPLPEAELAGYRYEQVGRYHNYHVTPQTWWWPQTNEESKGRLVIDAFSPNLNKELHIGHLRNLALARSLQQLLKPYDATFVALLGATLGVTQAGKRSWEFWTDFVHYRPTVYYDVLLPIDLIQMRKETNIELPTRGAHIWDGPCGPVIVKRSDGQPLYAYYDLAFAKEVAPSHYITGYEQKEHFARLGLADKHLGMGLVLGSDGKKLKSRTGDALLATEAMSMIRQLLGIDDENRSMQIAWNILCWNFLHAARETNLKFEVKSWVRTEAPGMYITYTYARLLSAFGPKDQKIYDAVAHESPTQEDAKLLGLAEQLCFYRRKAVAAMDPAPVANFTHELAKALSLAYEREPIRGGRPEFVRAVGHGIRTLQSCLELLGMFPVATV